MAVDLGLTGKVALVTGAGRGIGRAIAMTLAAEGVRVGVNDYFQDRADSVANEIVLAGGKPLPLQADVTDYESVQRMIGVLVERFGRLDMLVNNAGIPPQTGLSGAGGSGFGPPFTQTTPESWRKAMDVITLGTLNCTHASLPHLIAAGGGSIVCISSDAGRVGEPRLVAYSMAKGGVIAFVKALAREESRNGIRVNCIAPSTTETAALEGFFQDTSPEGKARVDALLRQHPLGRKRGSLGQPQDIADAVAFIVSDKAAWVTGQVWSVNGGYSMV
jgi:NAD(P)-dependent dehydrogenase (short-subunit alcohol dehydrogenase family)